MVTVARGGHQPEDFLLPIGLVRHRHGPRHVQTGSKPAGAVWRGAGCYM